MSPLARGEEDWTGANQAKLEKLRLRGLQRRARASGVELRHSDYGYALIPERGKPLDNRNDMSLNEIERWLDRASKQ